MFRLLRFVLQSMLAMFLRLVTECHIPSSLAKYIVPLHPLILCMPYLYIQEDINEKYLIELYDSWAGWYGCAIKRSGEEKNDT